MNLKKKITISATALTVALSTAFPIAAAQSQPVKAVGIVLVHRVTAGENFANWFNWLRTR